MKIARLFRNGQSQAVRLPKEYRFSGDRVLIKKADGKQWGQTMGTFVRDVPSQADILI